MDRFESTLDINAPASRCYERWHQFDRFPGFMKNIRSVIRQGENQWHWIINAPFGQNIQWNAQIDSDERNHSISWHTVPPSDLNMQGTIRFDAVAPNQTRLRCFIQYEIPNGGLKEMLAHITHTAQRMVEDELLNFKHWVEGTTVPAEKAHQGKSLAAEYENEGYTPFYGLEDDIPDVGSSTELPDTVEEGDVDALKELRQEENPYLGMQGAVYSEDVIDMRADRIIVEEFDVFTESMDVDEEDLASFTEDLDDEIDAALSEPHPYQKTKND